MSLPNVRLMSDGRHGYQEGERQLVAGQRPIAVRSPGSDLGLFRHLERIIDLDAEVPDCAFQSIACRQ